MRPKIIWLLCVSIFIFGMGACSNIPVGLECASAADCGVGKICANGWCQPAGQIVCKADGTCPSDHACYRGICIRDGNPKRCEKDADCMGRFFCNEGVCSCYPEICNGLDDDCDGEIDEDFDQDKDGYVVCPKTGSGLPQDCDDKDKAIHPNATEICNRLDDDCDGSVDEDNVCRPTGCTTNADCAPWGGFCSSGQCRYSGCISSEYCPPGYLCRDNKCQKQGCPDIKCPDGQVCKEGLCTCPTALCGVSCVDLTSNASHCGACRQACKVGYVCFRSMCTPPPCSSDADCSAGQFCKATQCMEKP